MIKGLYIYVVVTSNGACVPLPKYDSLWEFLKKGPKKQNKYDNMAIPKPFLGQYLNTYMYNKF